MAGPRIDNADAKWLPSTNGVRMERIEFLSGGTSTSDYMASAAPDEKWLKFYCRSTAATGDAHVAYLRLNLNGAGTGAGEAVRAYAVATAALTTGSFHGIHATAELGVGGTETGQSAGVRATWAVAAQTLTVTGTHAALLVETAIGAGVTLSGQESMVRFVDSGSVKPAILFDFTGLTAADTASAIQADTGAVGSLSHYLVCKVPGGAAGYIPVYSSHS